MARLLQRLAVSGGEVLEAEQRQFETILYAHFLEQTGQINLHGAFGDLQAGSDLLVFQALAQQCDELSFASGQDHAPGDQEAVGEGLSNHSRYWRGPCPCRQVSRYGPKRNAAAGGATVKRF
jgi:hypothetical protein